MIFQNTVDIGHVKLTVLLINSMETENINEALNIIDKDLKPPYYSIKKEEEAFYIFDIKNERHFYIIASQDNLCWENRLLITYNKARMIHSFLFGMISGKPVSFPFVLTKVGGALNEAYMYVTERIIMESKDHGK